MTSILQKRLPYLILAAFALSIAGCGDTGDKNVYVIEQLHFKADRLKNTKLGIKPELLTDADYQEMIDAYMSVIKTYELNYSDVADKDSITEDENRVSFLAGKSLIEIALLYDTQGNDAKTIETLEDFASQFPHNREHKALALLQLGRKYENAGEADKAEVAWMRLLDGFFPPADSELHPNTDILELPVKLAKLYHDLEDEEKTEQLLDYAEKYYKRIIDQYKYSPLGFTTTRFLADTYVMRNKPDQAIALLETVTDSTGELFGTAQMIIADICLTSLGDTMQARQRYETVIGSEHDSLSHPKAYMQLAKIEFLHRNYIECRKHIAALQSKFERYRPLQAQVQRLLANTFEKENDFNRAFSEYQWLLTNFPDSKEAIDTYRYLPGFLERNEQTDLAAEWYGKAIDFLSDTRDNQNGTFLGLSAHGTLVNMHVDKENWVSAATQLERLQADYPRSAPGLYALTKAGNIYRDKLKDREKAAQSYERQLNLYPDLPISEEARTKLEELRNADK
jgi:tetratricopeptide (TPR) repeat protein